jgi:hypothetical protein
MVVTRSTARKLQAQVAHHSGYHYVGKATPKSDAEARDASHFLKQLWQLPSSTQHIPVPNPVSLLRQDMPKLREQTYHVSAKLDGVRFLLLMGMPESGGTPYSYIIDRAYHMYKVQAAVGGGMAAAVAMGTLIDGELLQDAHGRMHFIGFDIMAAEGADCTDQRYELRLQTLQRIMAQIRIEGCRSCSAKECLPASQIRELRRRMEASPYPTDGLIFMPDRLPVRTGMHTTMYKWKPHHTIDFQLTRHSDGRPALLYSCADGLHPCSELRIQLVEDGTLRELSQHIPCIVECSCTYHGDTIHAQILTSRPDKTTPNFERTVVLTLQNIREHITCDELVAAICC